MAKRKRRKIGDIVWCIIACCAGLGFGGALLLLVGCHVYEYFKTGAYVIHSRRGDISGPSAVAIDLIPLVAGLKLCSKAIRWFIDDIRSEQTTE